MSTNTYKGGCLCGKVRFEITGEIENIIYCHCSQCRKVQGSAFATNGNVDVEAFIFLSGEDELTGYQSSPGQTKHFCKHCGSPIISRNESVPNKVRVRLGTIESDIRERPIAHIFITSKANWEELPDNLPQYESFEPGR
ncbi:MAG: GFA family protein [gamma proteobacterium endosymbiont of Lamellibrachia anaximandri]|nr:GFA family protein [gamma proteobacterium endosymbiont of Lamellibrachia anaximandri]MBL3533481.1 GFA family protein [gamma proteobacterium endosymbiont of Lamellibrachia anaximandri]